MVQRAKQKHRFLLISLPWADYLCPSLSIGTLASYARSKGYEGDALHLHLETAALFGIEDYDELLWDHKPVAEALSAALLFPKQRRNILESYRAQIPHLEKKLGRIDEVYRHIYASIRWNDYSLVGFTANFKQLFSTLLFASWIKQDHPRIPIILGGRLVSGRLGVSVMKHFEQIDWCIDGEGEQPFVAMLEVLSRGKTLPASGIPGLIYRDKLAGIVVNKKVQLTRLAGFPDPDFDHYFHLLEQHPLLKKEVFTPYLPVEVSRGCNFCCAFCCDRTFFHGHRLRPADEIAASMKRLRRRYQTSRFFLVSLMITKRCCEQLFPRLISQNADYIIRCEFRAGLERKHLMSMKLAGVCTAQIGIEALDTTLLKKMNKGSRFIDNLCIMKFCEELGIDGSSNLIVGFPTETPEDMLRSIHNIDFAESFAPPVELVEFGLRDGSHIYENPELYKIYDVDDAADFGKFVLRERPSIYLWQKSFKRSCKRADLNSLRARYNKWRSLYFEARRRGLPLLYYVDMNSELCVHDSRSTFQTIKLVGLARELYLFCDTIRGWREIVTRFKKYEPSQLQSILSELAAHKIMFQEDQDYLSLAIRYSKKVIKPLSCML